MILHFVKVGCIDSNGAGVFESDGGRGSGDGGRGGGGRDGRGRKQLSRQPTTAAVAAIGATQRRK